jgi:hypothetical protein
MVVNVEKNAGDSERNGEVGDNVKGTLLVRVLSAFSSPARGRIPGL